jgi:hypothetical protein
VCKPTLYYHIKWLHCQAHHHHHHPIKP